MANKLSPGDIVLVDFEAWDDRGNLFDTTREAVAKENGWEVTVPLRPMPVLLGGGRVVPGFEAALLEAEVGADAEVEVPPTKAFGIHDPGQVKMYPLRDFEKQELEPEPGGRIEIGGRRGTIVQVTASRVRVDFNHIMAGRTLTYKYKVVEKAEGDEARLRSLLAIDYAVTRADDFDLEVKGKEATVKVPEAASFDSNWFLARHRLAHDLFEHTGLDKVSFVDTMTRAQLHAHGHGQAHGSDEGEAAAEEE